MRPGQCAMRKRNWDGSVLDYGVMSCDTQWWLSCLYSETQIDAIPDTIDDLKPVLLLALHSFHMSLKCAMYCSTDSLGPCDGDDPARFISDRSPNTSPSRSTYTIAITRSNYFVRTHHGKPTAKVSTSHTIIPKPQH